MTAATLATAVALTGKFDLGSKIGERFRGVVIGFMASAASSTVPYVVIAMYAAVDATRAHGSSR